ncbi:hypothetical protein EW146_g3699 [Bondarzewia mesenterica]|uniref:Peptidase S53 domain-containing protein n=1 Tax=Bondarzewia mesenterica TaxID=1095465 RepID=A0A4S4M2K9_9AGAM|nr:hypothetical protein EW146_g3699 [Bondarzewia mesenterica]
MEASSLFSPVCSVTSVGCTTGVSPEVAATLSGDFSNYFDRPSYQDDAASAYLETLGTENVIIAFEGRFTLVAGMSCASPISASIIALTNDKLIAAGKSVVGFLNPLIYSSPSAFNDSTSDDNPRRNNNTFPTASGWDPVIGFGSPTYSA